MPPLNLIGGKALGGGVHGQPASRLERRQGAVPQVDLEDADCTVAAVES